jgi:hypothetical protein
MAVAYRVFSRTAFSVSLSDDGILNVKGWPLRWTREIPVESINVISLPCTTNHFFSRSERLEIVHTEGRIPVMYRLEGLDDLVERLQRQNHSITVVRSERDSSFL